MTPDSAGEFRLTSEATMPSGAIRIFLQECDDMLGESDGFILDATIAQKTRLQLSEVRDCLENLDTNKMVELVRLIDGLKVRITTDGRLFLIQRRRFLEESR
jgi:hypothetical protein